MNNIKDNYSENTDAYDTCEFDRPWKTREGNATWNENDTLGAVLIGSSITAVLSLFLAIGLSMFKGPLIVFLSLLGISLLIITLTLVVKPVAVMYPASAIISSRLRTPEFLNVRELFPNSARFETKDTFAKIQSELKTFMMDTNEGHDLVPTAETFGGSNKTIGADVKEGGKSWRLFQIKAAGEIMPGADMYFPTIVKTLEGCPEVISCMVSLLEPRVMIPSHVGYMKGVTRYMLPIKVPKDRTNCFLCVNKKKYSWTEGQGMLWDDTYPHMVRNDTDETRVVMYCDVLRPTNTRFENSMMNAVIKMVKASSILSKQAKQQEKQIQTFSGKNTNVSQSMNDEKIDKTTNEKSVSWLDDM